MSHEVIYTALAVAALGGFMVGFLVGFAVCAHFNRES